MALPVMVILQEGVLGIFRPKKTKSSESRASTRLQLGITFDLVPISKLFE